MLENSFLINNNVDRQIFYYSGGTWQTWQKPEGRTVAHILLIGGGGGGGGGAGLPTTPRAGGGGGGASPTAVCMFPLILLPDTLYIKVGAGGTKGIGGNGGSGTNGGAGEVSYISAYPSITNTDVIAISGNAANAGGGGSTSIGAGGSGGGAISINTASPRYLNLGIFRSIAGLGGGTGPTIGTPSLSFFVGNILTGGAGGGGGGSSTAGGGLTTLTTLPQFSRAIAGGTSPGGVGSAGIMNAKPLFFTGSTGGASSTVGAGGSSAKAQIGCGGGGGGASSTIGGDGGEGGDGIVIITCY